MKIKRVGIWISLLLVAGVMVSVGAVIVEQSRLQTVYAQHAGGMSAQWVPQKKELAPQREITQRNASPTNDEDLRANDIDDQDAEFDHQAKRLAVRLRDADPDKQSSLRKELEQLNERHFDYRQQQRKQEIERLSSRVDSLRLTQLRRQENKAEILKRRMNELTNPKTGLEWDGISGEENTASDQGRSDDQIPEKEIPALADGPKSSSEPTYNGKTRSECLRILETERNAAKIQDALYALKYLDVDLDVVRAIIHMSQSRATLHDQVVFDLPQAAVIIMCLAPSDVVINELLVELNAFWQRKPKNGFKELILKYFDSLASSSTSYSRLYDSTFEIFQVGSGREPLVGVPNEVAQSARSEIRRRSRRLVSMLVKIAQQVPGQDGWVFAVSRSILELSEQPLKTYPDLIPVVERIFANPRSHFSKAEAAILLGNSDLQVPEVLAFFKSLLKFDTDVGGKDTFKICEANLWISQLATHLPEVATLVADEIVNRWKKLESDSTGPDDVGLLMLIDGLGQLGEPAKETLPLLHSLETSSPSLRKIPRESVERRNVPSVTGRELPIRHNVRAYIVDAIKQIEEAKPKNKVTIEPLPDDDPQVSARSPANSGSRNAPLPTAIKAAQEVQLPTPVQNPRDAGLPAPVKTINVQHEEQTFDGITYSQWLKMLETERKPTKVAQAFEACGRLAERNDEHRIARGIFLAAGRFETGEVLRGQIWDNGREALNRLSVDVVVDELVTSLRDEDSYKYGYYFQSNFLMLASKSVVKAVKARDIELIGELLKLIRRADSQSDYLLATASKVCVDSDRPLSDFEGLAPLLIKMIDDGRPLQNTMDKSGQYWLEVATNFVKKAPETSDLALMLAKSIDRDLRSLPLIGKLGRRAEPTVPLLVDRFLREWKQFEPEFFGDVNTTTLQYMPAGTVEPRQGPASNPESSNRIRRMTTIVQVLGQIGVGEKGFVLLQQLNLIASTAPEPGNQIENDLFSSTKWAFEKFERMNLSSSAPRFFDDVSMLNGRWLLRLPNHSTAVVNLRIRGSFVALTAVKPVEDVQLKSIISNSRTQIAVVETTNPKQISMFSRNGIYELTDSTLRIQLAKPNEARPTEFVKDGSSLPEGQVLLEFERSSENDSEDKTKN